MASGRVEPGIAIAAGVGLLALGLLLTWSWFQSSDLDDGGSRSAARHGSEREGGRRLGPGISSSDADEANPSTQIVGGLLIDDESGPLADGRVDLWCEDGRLGSRTKIDADGSFAGPACSGRTCVRLVHPVFEQPEAWELEPDSVRELSVARASGIAGTVVGESGEPIANANLMLRVGQQRATARTDADGTFAMALPRERPCDACDGEDVEDCRAGDLPTGGSGREATQPHGGRGPSTGGLQGREANLLVWAPEFAPREIEIALVLGSRAALTVVLGPPAPAITGRVIGPDGIPMGLRTVVLAIHVEREAEQHAAVVDADGTFSFADLADAQYRLRALRDGQELAVLDRAAPGDRVELRVERALHGRDLQLEVRDADDRPTPGARVDGGPFRGAKTDEFGLAEAPEVLQGRYTLSVRVAGCPVVRTEVEVGLEADAPIRELVRLPAGCVMP